MVTSLKSLVKNYDLDLFILFGSRAKGSSNANSDYDFAYLGNLSFDDKLSLLGDLTAFFKTDSIDLVNISKKHSIFFRFEIFNFAKLIFESKLGLFSRCRTAARIDYIDFKPQFNLRQEMIRKKVGAL